ncbi:MAG: nucleotidyltransferase family protein [Acidobacteria bacterium]|nr:nucleotidyltransferase family protein [Acidobacteriota bacterium]
MPQPPFPSHLKTHRPNPEQELLLQAALLKGDPARAAWEAWCAKVDLQTLDDGSFRLLPLLYQNLKALGVEHPWLQVMKGIHRHTWVKNQTLLHGMTPVLKMFQQAGIEPIVLKGTALITRYYENFGLRPMGDFDVLVPRQSANQAIELLGQAGWTPGFRAPHAQVFRKSDGTECDLHWNLFFENCRVEVDDPFWQLAEPAKVGGVPVKVLNPTDQFLHVCVHGARWNPVPPLRWLADAVVILEHSTIDWNRLVQQATRMGLVLPLRDTLGYLAWLLGVEVPEAVLAELNQHLVSFAYRLDYRAWTVPPEQRGPGLTLWAYWREFEQWSYGADKSPHIWQFPQFLQHLWGVESVHKIPWLVIAGGVRRLESQMKN